MGKRIVWGILLAAGLIGAPAWATVPQAISVQGVLRDSTGKLQSMAVNVQATFFDAQTAGNPLAGPFNANNVMAVNGLFTVSISDTTLGGKLAASASGEVWLELAVGNDTFPRQQVTSEVFALECGTAENSAQLGGQSASAYLTTATAASTYLTQAAAAATYQPKGSYLSTTGVAADSSKLGGVAASGYQQVLLTQNCGVGKYIQAILANGTVTCGSDANSGGTVTSVAAGNGLSGGTITGSGTIALSAPVSIANGGTGSTSGDGSALKNLNGANIQAGTVSDTAIKTGALAHSHPFSTQVFSASQLISPTGNSSNVKISVACSAGTVTGGGCGAQYGGSLMPAIFSSPDGNGWQCWFSNTDSMAHTGYVYVVCATSGSWSHP